MDLVFRTLVFLSGIMLILIFFRSIIRVALLNRHQRDTIATLCARIVRNVLALFVRRKKEYDSIQRVMLWIFPLSILLLTATWFLLVTIGFALLFWAMHTVPDMLQALIASGSALSTLGFSTPTNTAGQIISIPEGAIGLGVVVYIFTFVPGYLTSMQKRTEKVGWIYARAGEPPSGVVLLESHQRGGRTKEMSDVWEDFEGWFRELNETHVLSPILVFVPSTIRGQAWISASVAMLDATALALSSLNMQGQESARLCYESGTKALLAISKIFQYSPPNESSVVSDRDTFEKALERLSAVGISVRSNREECWKTFSTLQIPYRNAAEWIAMTIFVPKSSLAVLVPVENKSTGLLNR